ncbi:M16 family metallopeptidase [Streptomyces sp. NBC_00859]|uniref:M16 family metallopeptidase n=1 Tax=Streptomyces sp. NBC_00859 TaxID=2903682 RepID=UPI0038661599|nr:insulinase family protein [Streptomyces sp. NBC_00859]WSZ86725.1 insulinase family protein [Streptomyces sp. NBC_00859]
MDQYRTIDNEIPVVAQIDERLHTTTICLASKYGARHDPQGQCGAAHLLEHVLMSAPVGSVSSLSEHVERLGGYANAETGPDRMLFYAQVGADDADDVARLLQQAVLEPRWQERVVEQEKRAVFQELAAGAADPSDVVQDAILADLFPGHPLGRPVGGLSADVEALDAAALAAAHAERLRNAALSVVVVGPRIPEAVDPAAAGVSASAFASLATLPVASSPVPSLAPSPPPAWPDEFAWLCVGAHSVHNHDPRRPHYNVLAQLMGSSPSSLLYRRLRGEAGLAYSFQAWNRGYGESGAWRVMAGVEPGNGETALKVIRDTLEELAERGPEPEDLASARRQAQMRILTCVDTPLECARFLAMRSGGPAGWSPGAEVDFIGRISAVDVRSAARQVLGGLRTVVRPEAK